MSFNHRADERKAVHHLLHAPAAQCALVGQCFHGLLHAPARQQSTLPRTSSVLQAELVHGASRAGATGAKSCLAAASAYT